MQDKLMEIMTASRPPLQSLHGDRDMSVSEVSGTPGSKDRINSLRHFYERWECVQRSPFDEEVPSSQNGRAHTQRRCSR